MIWMAAGKVCESMSLERGEWRLDWRGGGLE